MPFAPAFDDTYLVAIQPAALAVNALAERVDHNGLPGEVLPQIKKMIETSEVVIADLSGGLSVVLSLSKGWVGLHRVERDACIYPIHT